MPLAERKPTTFLPLKQLDSVDQSHLLNCSGSGRRGASGAMELSSASRPTSNAGLVITAMGQFSAPAKLASIEERFSRSTSMSAGGPSSFAVGRASPMVRSSSEGGPGGVGSGMGKQTRSNKGEARNDVNRLASTPPLLCANSVPLELVAPLIGYIGYLKLRMREDLELLL